jgi:protein-disulfide isomerase
MIQSRNVQVWLVFALCICVFAQAFLILSLRKSLSSQPTHRFFDKSIIDFENQLVFGNPQAKNKVVLYTAPFCPPCEALIESALNLPWQDQDQVQLIIKYTVSDRDQWQPSSAVFAASQQGAHQEMMFFFHQNPKASYQDIIVYANELNLDIDTFEKAMSSSQTEHHLTRNRAEGAYFELKRVPFLILGQNGYSSPTPEAFEEKILELMEESTS